VVAEEEQKAVAVRAAAVLPRLPAQAMALPAAKSIE
jgi:hypothetical protein